MEIPFAFAFTAGLVATLNPCGFAMLPADLSYFMGLDETEGHPTSTASSGMRALQVGGPRRCSVVPGVRQQADGDGCWVDRIDRPHEAR